MSHRLDKKQRDIINISPTCSNSLESFKLFPKVKFFSEYIKGSTGNYSSESMLCKYVIWLFGYYTISSKVTSVFSTKLLVFPGGSVAKESACNAGDTENRGSIPESGRYPGEGNGNLLHYCLENPTDRGGTVHGVTESQTQLKQLSTHPKLIGSVFC